MIFIIINIVVAAIVLGFIGWAATQVEFIKPWAKLVQGACAVIFFVVLIYAMTGLIGGPVYRPL